MAFSTCTTSTAAIEFVRSLNGNGLHVGILGAIPAAMIFMQLIAAWAANHVPYRRPYWFWATFTQRWMLVPICAGPCLFPQVSSVVWLWLFLSANVLTQALGQFGTPLWMSWMGDFLPRNELGHFWGKRQLFMQWTSCLVLLTTGAVIRSELIGVQRGFAMMVAIGSILGIIDLSVFHKIPEPKVTPANDLSLRAVFSAPFREPAFRGFIGYMALWNVAAMFGAPFISLYLLQVIKMPIFSVMLLWTFTVAAGATFSGLMGRFADRFGNKPLLVMSTAFKSFNMAALIFCPRDPELAFWVLTPIFMFDCLLTQGITIANDGFLLKNSPTENRTMFIAAGNAIAGITGGVTSILCGAWLVGMTGWGTEFYGYTINAFHILFAISLGLRLICAMTVARVQEAEAVPTWFAVREVLKEKLVRLSPRPASVAVKLSEEAQGDNRATSKLPSSAELLVPTPDHAA